MHGREPGRPLRLSRPRDGGAASLPSRSCRHPRAPPPRSDRAFRARVGEDVQWDVLAIGENFHVFHIHGHRWLRDGVPVDSEGLGPSETLRVRSARTPRASGTTTATSSPNAGRNRHTVTSHAGVFDSGALGPAGRAGFTLRAAGVYRVSVSAGGGLASATSPVIQFRPGRFHQ